MNEDVTKKLTADEKLDLILSDLGQVKARLTALEERVEDRLKDTRPIWQAIHAQTEKLVQQYAQLDERLGRVEEQNAQIDERLGRVEEQNAQIIQQNAKFDQRLGRVEEKMELLIEKNQVLGEDVMDVRGAQLGLKKRVIAIEQKVA